MSVRPVSVKTQNYKSKQPNKQSTRNGVPSFTANPENVASKFSLSNVPKDIIIKTMDVIAAGGFAAGFVTQDFLGMCIPRTWKALYRNKKSKDDNYNWGYAKLVGIREALSGPSSFLIPMAMLVGYKKYGKANNVPIDYINGFSGNFAKFAKGNKGLLSKPEELKKSFYEEAFKNLLESSLDNIPKDDAQKIIKEKSKLYATKLIEAEKAPKHYFWSALSGKKNTGKDIKSDNIVDDFNQLRKQYTKDTSNSVDAFAYKIEDQINKPKFDWKHLKYKDDKTEVLEGGKIAEFIDSLSDYTTDLTKEISNKFKESKKPITNFVKEFGEKRVSTRFVGNLLMTSAVILFYTIIPKLYNSKDGKNHALDGLDNANSQAPKVRKEGTANA